MDWHTANDERRAIATITVEVPVVVTGQWRTRRGAREWDEYEVSIGYSTRHRNHIADLINDAVADLDPNTGDIEYDD